MIISPFDTLACQGYLSAVPRLASELKKAYLFGTGFEQIHTGVNGKVNIALLLPSVQSNIKPFGHPIYFELSEGEKLLVADARDMYSINSAREVRPKTAMASSLAWVSTRLQLQQLWETQNYRLLQTCLDYPTMLYGKVYSEALGKKFGLDPLSMDRCAMVLAYAFWCFSHTDEQYKAVDKRTLAHGLATKIGATSNEMFNTIGNLEFFYNLNDLISALQDEEIIGTKRLMNITTVTMFEIARTTWYVDAGAPSSEIAACALEHAPTWMACVFVSLANQSFKNNLATIAQRYRRTADPAAYVNSIAHLIMGQ